MPESGPEENGSWYSYAIIRVVPRVERGEFVNAGVIVFSRSRNYIGVRIELDEQRLLALAPNVDLAEVRRRLQAFEAVARGGDDGGPVANGNVSERFHWLTTPRSTLVQTSPVHLGRCEDPEVALEELMQKFVR